MWSSGFPNVIYSPTKTQQVMSPGIASNTSKNPTIAVDTKNSSAYTSRYSVIFILNIFKDFTLFKTSMRTALFAARTWQIVQGGELPPVIAAGRPLQPAMIDYQERVTRAIQLMLNSVAPKNTNRLEPFLWNKDPAGM